jgi:uncharacterized protein (UPF0548 family)
MAKVLLVGSVDPNAELTLLRGRPLNFDPNRRHEYTPETGWHIDDYAVPLPGETPGPPIHGGPWEIACRLSKAYKFVDPTVVRAFYDSNEALEERTMLLEVHFWGLRIYVGVRVGSVSDRLIELEGRSARVFSWTYRTLEKHFEMGEISYQVWKWLDSGEIDFRIHAYSRRADPGNALVRLGFLLFGRRKQIKFATGACDRMAALAAKALSDGRGADAKRSGDLEVRPDPRS